MYMYTYIYTYIHVYRYIYIIHTHMGSKLITRAPIASAVCVK